MVLLVKIIYNVNLRIQYKYDTLAVGLLKKKVGICYFDPLTSAKTYCYFIFCIVISLACSFLYPYLITSFYVCFGKHFYTLYNIDCVFSFVCTYCFNIEFIQV